MMTIDTLLAANAHRLSPALSAELRKAFGALEAELARLRAVEPCCIIEKLGEIRGLVRWVCHTGRPLSVGDSLYAAPPAQPAEPLQPQWRDIESAPRDHTEILLSNGEHVSSGAWFTGEDDHEAQWMDWSGGMLPEPTHWMPIPPAPKASHDPR
jgi:hypothetical protein